MAADSAAKLITLQSSDGEEFLISEAVAMLSQTIQHLIEAECAQNTVPLPNVTSKVLAKVIEYCSKHVVAAATKADAPKTEEAAKGSDSDEDVKKWDAEFMDIELDMLYELILAANYLNIKGLLDLTCQKVANMIKGKPPHEIRKIFNIKNDFSPEEKEEIRRENSWAFD